jgi:hypothetical protein
MSCLCTQGHQKSQRENGCRILHMGSIRTQTLSSVEMRLEPVTNGIFCVIPSNLPTLVHRKIQSAHTVWYTVHLFTLLGQRA